MKRLGYLILIVGTACHTFRDSPVQIPAASPVLETIDLRSAAGDLLCPGSVQEFYRLREQKLFWSRAGRLYPLADSLLDIIATCNSYGLEPEHYRAPLLKFLVSDTVAENSSARIDVLLTDAYLALLTHLRDGVLDGRTLQRRDLAAAIDTSGITSLQHVNANSLRHTLEAQEPSFRQYHELKAALQNVLLKAETKDSLWQQRAFALMLNMERWRWQKLPPDRYVSVNIPSFMMRVVEDDSTWLKTKVIVGKKTTPTPVTQSVITSFTIYPYWHAPRSIATKELLPALQADAGYLERNNFQVLNKSGAVIPSDTIRWKLYSADHFPFVLRQREGSENSMGIIKFNFANRYGVYLHDTNGKRLFERTRRDLSHGCVRVNKAVDFARYLVKDDDIYVSPEDLDQYLSLRQRLKVDLRKPITVKLEYFTAEVENGQPVFHEDIYKRDSVMLQMMLGTPAPSAGAPTVSVAL